MLRLVMYDVEGEEVSGVAARITYAFICFRLLYPIGHPFFQTL